MWSRSVPSAAYGNCTCMMRCANRDMVLLVHTENIAGSELCQSYCSNARVLLTSHLGWTPSHEYRSHVAMYTCRRYEEHPPRDIVHQSSTNDTSATWHGTPECTRWDKCHVAVYTCRQRVGLAPQGTDFAAPSVVCQQF